MLKKGSVISISNHKGGVGKTTTAINLAAGLGRSKHLENPLKVLLIDIDPQRNATSTTFPFNKKEYKKSMTILDVFKGENIINAITETNIKNVSLCPSHIDLFDIESRISNSARAVEGLRAAINNSGIKDEFDFIIIDTPPNLGLFMINSFAASDYYILVIESESSYALEGISTLSSRIDEIKEVSNPDLKLLGHLITMHDGRNSTCKHMEREIKNIYKDSIFNTHIRRNTDLAKANIMKKSIFQHDLRVNGAKDYADLTEEVLGRIVK
jgi:chromosome partitioning protein